MGAHSRVLELRIVIKLHNGLFALGLPLFALGPPLCPGPPGHCPSCPPLLSGLCGIPENYQEKTNTFGANPFPSRSFLLNRVNYTKLYTLYSGSHLKSKSCNSIEELSKFFSPDNSIFKMTSPPQLHILLGIINKTQRCILTRLNEAQKKTFLNSCKLFRIYWA